MPRGSNESLESCTATPAKILELIGPEGLENIAEQARCDCITLHIRDVIWNWYEKELKAGRVQSLEDLGAAMGRSKATASRYLSGQIRRTDLLEADLILRRLGTSLGQVLPSESAMRHAILCATTRAFLQARGGDILSEGVVLLTRNRISEIDALVAKCPMPPEAAERGPMWIRWLERARVHADNYASELKSEKNAKSNIGLFSAVMAGDWQFSRVQLPWQVFAMLIALFERIVDGVVRTNAPERIQQKVRASIYRRTSGNGQAIEYEAQDIAHQSATIGSLKTREEILCFLTRPPRKDIIEDFGTELSEWIIFEAVSKKKPRRTLIRLALGWTSDDSCLLNPSSCISANALKAYYVEMLTQAVAPTCTYIDGKVIGSPLTFPTKRLWSAEFDVSLPPATKLEGCEEALLALQAVKDTVAAEVLRRMKFSEQSIWDEAWKTGFVGDVPIWRFAECKELIHRAEFWTAIWGGYDN